MQPTTDASRTERHRLLWHHWPCWIAVAFGSGIAAYFGLPVEPPAFGSISLILLAVSVFSFGLYRRSILPPAILILFVAAGFAIAQWRTVRVAAPSLPSEMERVQVTGSIEEIELLPAGERVTLGDVEIARLPLVETPRRVRLKVIVDQPELMPGQRVRASADLSPPQGPAAPGAYDFRRDAYFQGLGAVGFAYGRLELANSGTVASDESRWLAIVGAAISDLRHRIARRIRTQLPEGAGALAVALIVGDQRPIAKSDVEAMRDSGLAHILSISGLHIGLAAGLVFVSLRAMLAAVPAIALNYPIKKWSAVGAIAAALGYAILAGWTTPTQRAFIMGGLVFTAVLFDRSPISLRLVAIAALFVLALRPEVIVGPSFQMSFSAVFFLIVAFERLGPMLADARKNLSGSHRIFGIASWLASAGFWLIAAMVSSLVASSATMPFAILHFDRVAVYSVAANALAVPLTGFWIMPSAVLSLIAMPFGLEHWPLVIMGTGCEALLWIAHSISDWPGASILVPAPPSWALPVVGAGLIAIGLVPGKWRWWGLIPVVIGTFAGYALEKPVLLVAPGGALVGFRAPDGGLVMSKSQGAGIVRETWMRREALQRVVSIDSLAGDTGWLECVVDHCRWRGGIEVSVVLDGDLVSSAPCRSASLVIILRGWDKFGCSRMTQVIDRTKVMSLGAIAIFEDTGSYRITTSVALTGRRPWSMAQQNPSDVSDQ